MGAEYQQIRADQRGDVWVVHLCHRRLSEAMVGQLAEEMTRLVREGGARKVALSLGPGSPDCLYSVFLAKLFSVQRRIQEAGGRLILCDVTPDVGGVFDACRLTSLFEFAPDVEGAVARLAGAPAA